MTALLGNDRMLFLTPRPLSLGVFQSQFSCVLLLREFLKLLSVESTEEAVLPPL